MKISRSTLRCGVVCVTAFAGAAAPMLAIAGLAAPIVLTGCKKKAPPAPPPPPPPPPAKPKPADPVNVDSVVKAAKPDPRVQFPQSAAPTDASLATAIVEFSNALVKGDSDSFGAKLSDASRNDLAALVSSGEWETSTAKLEAVRVVGAEDLAPTEDGTGTMTAARVSLAVQEPGEAYVLAWTARKKGSAWEFEGANSPEGTKRRASDFDNGAAAGGSADAGSGGSAPAASASTNDLSAVITWAKSEMERRVTSASKNGGVATPAPAAPVAVRSALDAGISPAAADVKAIIDIGLAKAKEGGGVVSNEKVFQYASQILNLGEPAIRALYEGKDAGGPGGQASNSLKNMPDEQVVQFGLGSLVLEYLAKQEGKTLSEYLKSRGFPATEGTSANEEYVKTKAKELLAKGVMPDAAKFAELCDSDAKAGTSLEIQFAACAAVSGIPAEKWKAHYDKGKGSTPATTTGGG